MNRPREASAGTPGRLRVLHIVPELGVGGLPRVVETLCSSTNPDRFEVRVLCLEFRGAIGDALRERGITVDVIPNAKHPDRLAVLKVIRYLIRSRVDVVHTHNTQAFLEGFPGAVITGVRTRIHTDHARRYPDHTRLLIAERFMARFATRVVAVSDRTARDLQQHQRIPARRITIVPNGVDGSLFTRAIDVAAKRRALGLLPAGPVLGLVGRLVEEKGIIYLIQAAVDLRRRFPNLQVVIVGEGYLEQELKNAAVDLGANSYVRFLGLRHDTPELLKVFDLLVLPSVSEGLPMAVLEAMAASLPIVASDVGGVSMAVRDGENGLLVPPADARRLASAVEALLNDVPRRSAYGAASRRFFEERFSARAMANAYEALYTGVA